MKIHERIDQDRIEVEKRGMGTLRSLHDSEHIIGSEYQQRLVVYGYFRAGIATKNHPIALVHIVRHARSIRKQAAIAHTEHSSLSRLLLGGFGQDNAAGSCLVSTDSFHYQFIA
jgi:hypothetical protein